MPLLRNTKQAEQTKKKIEDYYFDLSMEKTNSIAEISKNMLKVIEMINTNFKETDIWGLTSHARLILQAEDRYDSKQFVIITVIGDEYYFEYLLTDDKKPWQNATVKGRAQNLEEAEKYLLISMNESGGWKNSVELKTLLNKNGII